MPNANHKRKLYCKNWQPFLNVFFLHRKMIVKTWMSVSHRSCELQAAHLSPKTLVIIRISIQSCSEKVCTYISK